MNSTTRARWAAIALVCVALAGCGGGGGDDDAQEPPASTALIGAAGGTVAAAGAKAVVPAGALAQATTISVEPATVGAPPLPAGVTAFGPMFVFTPHGTAFAVPVTVTLPFDVTAAVPAGMRVALYKTTANQAGWERVAGATVDGNTMTAPIGSFSFVQPVVEPLFRGDPVREYTFNTFLGRTMTLFERLSGRQEGGVLEAFVAFGNATSPINELLDHDFVTLDGSIFHQDGIADGQVFSTADGVTYGAFAEAPLSGSNRVDGAAGGRSQLKQYQAYIKRAADATMTFTLSRAFIDLRDDNGGFNSPTSFDRISTCSYPAGQVAALDACQDIVRGQLILAVTAYTHATSAVASGRTFFHTAGVATAFGHTSHYSISAVSGLTSRTPMWNANDFNVDISANGTFLIMELKQPRTFTIDLSSIAVGEEFTLRSVVLAEATNRQGDKFSGGRELPSGAAAFLRDPLGTGGSTVVHRGVEVISNPVLVAPPDLPVLPAACTAAGGVDPQAGVIQFSAAAYTLEGHGAAEQTVRITRTGGSRGAVTATFTTGNGSAVAGTDYVAMSASVFFADGDSEPRIVTVEPVRNLVDGEADKTVNLRLADPGNCAGLGPQSTAVLTLVDNRAPPLPQPTGLDPTFGVDGKAAMPETGTPPEGFGGGRSAMALQADGKIVVVGGSNADFILARFNADGSVDTAFGIDGKVTTDMGGGPFEQEPALGVAIQADGKIVVVGHTSIPTQPPAPDLPPTFALARYNTNGTLDTNFGIGGRVSGNVNGIAHAVAIQPDGRIVVAGEFSFRGGNGTDFADFTVARFNANGSLDLGFGGSGTGQVATDIGSAPNAGRNLVLQPNGAIVVSGKPTGSQPEVNHTDVVRYTAAGLPDFTFGGAGKLTIAGADVGQGLAQQADGKYVLVGSVVNPVAPATSRFLLKRLNADGTADLAFGTAGTVDTAFAQNVTADGVALQGDGKIVVVGSRAFSVNSNFIVARYLANGSIDTDFGFDSNLQVPGRDGNLSIDFFGFSDFAENVIVQPDGKLLVNGPISRNRTGYGLARLNP